MRTDFETMIQHNLSADLDKKVALIGTVDGQEDYGYLTSEYRSFLIGGQPGFGKTSVLAFFACQAVMANGRLLIIDPHCNNKQGLLPKIEPLSDWFIREPCDFEDSAQVVERFAWLLDEYESRKKRGGVDGKRLLFAIVDEWNELLDLLDKDELEMVIKAVRTIARGGRKYGIFMVLSAQNWNLESTGGSSIRKSVTGRITLNAETADMRMVLDTKDSRTLTELASNSPMMPGDAIMKRIGIGIQRLRYPETDRRGCEMVAALVRHIAGCSERSEVEQAVKRAYSNAEQTETEIAGIKREEGGKAFTQGAPNRPNMSPNTPNVAPSERARIIALGNRQLMETGKVVRRKLHEAMKKQVSGWDSDDYPKVMAVCNEMGWHRSMTLGMTAEQWEELKRQYNYTCLGCGRQEPEIKLEPDHVIPDSRGGSHDVSNRQPLCRECNNKKLTKSTDYRQGVQA